MPKEPSSEKEIGVDEAGRGCLWGPLFAGAVHLPPPDQWPENFVKYLPWIRDSKKVTEKRRAILKKVIQESGFAYGIGIVDAKEVDSLGATHANQLAFRRALDNLQGKRPGSYNIKIDGILPLREIREGETVETIVDGDENELSIATASILAKTARDDWVQEWAQKHSEEASRYDLAKCKG